MNWTQPICLRCYAIRYPERISPFCVRDTVNETCCDCGKPTSEGAYIRKNPKLVSYPTHKLRD